jgi:hypothetical protein
MPPLLLFDLSYLIAHNTCVTLTTQKWAGKGGTPSDIAVIVAKKEKRHKWNGLRE